MTSWFGTRYAAFIYHDVDKIPTPVGKVCLYCEEAIDEGDDGFMMSVAALGEITQQPIHRECMIRMTVGSVAHQMRTCSCFRKGSEEHDPPGASKRQSARAALLYANLFPVGAE
jgi:hypothetical protein